MLLLEKQEKEVGFQCDVIDVEAMFILAILYKRLSFRWIQKQLKWIIDEFLKQYLQFYISIVNLSRKLQSFP